MRTDDEAVSANASKMLPRRYQTVQAARFAAAILVAVFHYQELLGLPAFGGRAPFAGLLGFGHAGVEFFFVLSGFIIFFVHEKDLGNPSRLWSYARSRITRIWPLYLCVLLVYVLKDGGAGKINASDIFKSIILYPQYNFIVPQSWTLSHEIFFYIIFATTIINLRVGIIFFVIWACAIFYFLLFTSQHHLLGFVASDFDLLFFFGMAVAKFSPRHVPKHPVMLVVIASAGFVATGLLEQFQYLPEGGLTTLSFGAFSAIGLAGLIGGERSGALKAGTIAARGGALSYALYLTHGAVGAVLIPLFRHVSPWLPGGLVVVLCLAVAIAVAALAHRLVEAPAARLLQSWRRGRP